MNTLNTQNKPNTNDIIVYSTLKNLKRVQKEKSIKPTTSKVGINPEKNNDFQKYVTDQEHDIIDYLKNICTVSKSWKDTEDIGICDLIIKNEVEYKLLSEHRKVMKKKIDDYVDGLISKMNENTPPIKIIPPEAHKKNFLHFGHKKNVI